MDTIAELMTANDGRFDRRHWNHLVDRLRAHGVTYLTGGTAAGVRSEQAPVPDLVRDLATSPEPRLRDAIIALLLRHPEDASAVRRVLAELPPSNPEWRQLRARLIAAAALQRVWSFVLPIYLPPAPPIMVDDLVAELDLPAVDVWEGEALLRAAGTLVTDDDGAIDWVDGWEDAADHLVADLELAAAPRD